MWSEKYVTGIAELDEQHKDVITAIENLDRNVESNASDTSIATALTELLEELDKHFQVEERYMVDLKLPDLPAHKKEHDEFLTLVNEQLNAHRSRQHRFDAAYMGVISDWMINHFEGMDAQLSLSVMNSTLQDGNVDEKIQD